MSWTPANSFGTHAAHPSRIRVLSEHRESTDPSQVVTSSPALPPINPLAATLMGLPPSIANKRLTVWLSSLDAILTKNRGVPIMVNQDSLNFEILTSPQGPRRSWPSESTPAARRKRTTVRKSPSTALHCSQIIFQLSTVDLFHQSRVTRHASRFCFFLTSWLRYLLTSSLTNNCKLTTVNCFSPRPVDIQPFASDNSLSASSPRMAPITEEGE